MLTKKHQVLKASKLAIAPEDFTYGVTHGDYNVEQLIVRENKIVTVLDFQRVTYMPLVWEALRSYSLADPACEPGAISIKHAREYFTYYLKENPHITRRDLEMVPYLSYLHIANSTHGYKEYLEGGIENPESTLAYGRWYTQILRWLEKNVTELSVELSKMRK